MIAEIESVEQIVLQVKQLSPMQRLRLIQRITETLMPAFSQSSAPLHYGKYKSEQMSTLEDFTIAEWHPTDEERYGE